MTYKNEQPLHARTASLCRGCAILENGFNLICRWRALFRCHTDLTYTWRHYAPIAYDFNSNLHPVCAVYGCWAMNKFWIIFQTVVLAGNNFMNDDVILKTKCNVRLRNLPTFSFCFKLLEKWLGGAWVNVHRICLHKITLFKMSCNPRDGLSLVYVNVIPNGRLEHKPDCVSSAIVAG